MSNAKIRHRRRRRAGRRKRKAILPLFDLICSVMLTGGYDMGMRLDQILAEQGPDGIGNSIERSKLHARAVDALFSKAKQELSR